MDSNDSLFSVILLHYSETHAGVYNKLLSDHGQLNNIHAV